MDSRAFQLWIVVAICVRLLLKVEPVAGYDIPKPREFSVQSYG